jgi:cytochrome c
MNSFEFNKIAGAFLFSLLLILGVQNISSVLYSTEEANPLSYPVEVAGHGADTHGEGAAEVEAGPTLAQLLASADIAKGEKVAKKCAACHTFDDGGANKIGPNLFGVVGRSTAQVAGFNYSSPMSAIGGEWDFERLNAFLEKPSAYVSGTAMSFAGLRKAGDRANILAYLNSLGSNVALPAVEAPAE